MNSSVQYYTRQFLDIYRQELHKIGIDKDSVAEQMMVTILQQAAERFVKEVK